MRFPGFQLAFHEPPAVASWSSRKAALISRNSSWMTGSFGPRFLTQARLARAVAGIDAGQLESSQM